MKLRKYMPLGSPSLDPAATPLKRNWKKILHLNRRNKDRLWVALYKYTGPGAKGGEDLKYQRPNPRQDPDKITPVIDPEDRKYHWALLVGPKNEHPYLAVPGTRLEVTANMYSGQWIMYRHYEVNIKNTGNDMLVRMLVGKIVDKKKFYNLVYAVHVDQDNRSYRNMEWLFEALTELQRSEGVVTEESRLDWMEVRDMIKSMCEKRVAQGKFEGHQDMNTPKAAFDLMEGRWVWDP